MEATGTADTVSSRRAADIMGKNFFSPDEAAQHFHYNLGQAELAALAEVPFAESVLEACKHTHALLAMLPISILDMCETVGPAVFYRPGDAWYKEKSFAREKGELGWRLVRTTPAAGSMQKNWHQQQTLLSEGEEVPSARVLVYTVLAYLLSGEKWLLDGIWVSTSDSPEGDRVTVGTGIVVAGSSVRYLYISRTYDECNFAFLGLGSMQK